MTCILCSWADCLEQLSRQVVDGHDIQPPSWQSAIELIVFCTWADHCNRADHSNWTGNLMQIVMKQTAWCTCLKADRALSFAMWVLVDNSMVNSAHRLQLSWPSVATDLTVCCNSAENCRLFNLLQDNRAGAFRCCAAVWVGMKPKNLRVSYQNLLGHP